MKIIFLNIILFLSFSISNQRIDFISANPFSFNDIITNLQDQESQNVYGNLKFPDNYDSNKKYPLVIGVAGSLDWTPHNFEYLEMYRKLGIATFELNSFQSRGIQTTVGSQTEVTVAMIILDVYKAFEELANHPNIDKDKVGLTGWSLGGVVTLYSAWKPLKDAIGTDLKFASRLAFYPLCIAIPNKIDFQDTPTHILIGEIDDWTPADACIEYQKIMNDNGYDFNITVYENSHHGFDSDVELTSIENAYSFNDCRLKIKDNGIVTTKRLGFPLTNPTFQVIALAFCADRGATLGKNPVTREKAFLFSEQFISKHLLSK